MSPVLTEPEKLEREMVCAAVMSSSRSEPEEVFAEASPDEYIAPILIEPEKDSAESEVQLIPSSSFMLPEEVCITVSPQSAWAAPEIAPLVVERLTAPL